MATLNQVLIYLLTAYRSKLNKNKTIVRKINNEKDNTLTLPQIVESKINISFDEYQSIKEIAINSVARNIKSISAMNSSGNCLFVYLPTKFGFSQNQKNIKNRVNYRKLNVRDLSIIEKDYRESLIADLRLIDGLKVSNMATTAEDKWFSDESHYTLKGQEKISKLLLPLFTELLGIR